MSSAHHISRGIADEIADVTETGIDALPCLYDSVDPEALDNLFDTHRTSHISITFTYAGCTVTVSSDNDMVEIAVEPFISQFSH